MTEPTALPPLRPAVLEDDALGLPDAPAGTPVRELASEAGDDKDTRRLAGRRARVTLEGPDGHELEPFEVRVDNRDYLRWDRTAARQKWVGKREDAVPMFLMATFLAWSAANRQGLTTLTWTQFEAAAIAVEELTQDDQDAVRPTR